MSLLAIILMSAAGGAGGMAALVRYSPTVRNTLGGGGGPKPELPK